MGNTYLNITMVTNEALVVLTNSLGFAKRVNRQYDDRYAVPGAKIGNTVFVRKPPRYIVKKGQALQVQDFTETQVPVTLTEQAQVAMSFTTADLALDIDNFSERVVKPAIAAIANQIDLDGLKQYKNIANFVGVPGTVPNALLTYLQSKAVLDNNACPRDGNRHIALNPTMEVTIVDALKALFQSSDKIREQYDEGTMGYAIGSEWMMDQNINTHVVGTCTGTPLVNGANQTGSSIITDGWTVSAAILNAGDIISFAGVFQINPQSRQSTGVLQPFVVTADVVADGGGNATIPVYPPLTPAGPDQQFSTVTVTAADNAVITVFNIAQAGLAALAGTSSPQGLAYHRDAFTLATADLYVPNGVDMAAKASDPETGLSIRIIRDYSIDSDKAPTRCDVLYGWASLRQELACRIAS